MTTITLNDWERRTLSLKVSADFLTYATHHARGHLRPHEIEEMERYKALSDKLTGCADKPVTSG